MKWMLRAVTSRWERRGMPGTAANWDLARMEKCPGGHSSDGLKMAPAGKQTF